MFPSNVLRTHLFDKSLCLLKNNPKTEFSIHVNMLLDCLILCHDQEYNLWNLHF